MFQFFLGCVTKQRPDTPTELGRAAHAPGRGRGVAGAWPRRGPKVIAGIPKWCAIGVKYTNY